MPVDTSIYRMQRPVQQIQVADPMDTETKRMTLRQLALQNEAGAQKLKRDEKDGAYQDHLRKASAFGSALDSISGLPENERANAYSGVRNELVNSGIISPEQAPEQYDPMFYQQTLGRYHQTKEYLDNQLTKAKIASTYAQRDSKLAQKNANVPGFAVAPDASPTKDDVKQFKTQLAAHDKAQQVLNRFRGLVNESGTEIFGTQSKRDMRQALVEAQLQIKELANLGVLNGPDLDLMLKELPDPTAFTEQFNPWAGGQIVKTIASMQDLLQEKLKVEGNVRGFVPNLQRSMQTPSSYRSMTEREDNDGAAYAGSPDGSQPPHGLRVKQNGHVYDWNPKTGQYE